MLVISDEKNADVSRSHGLYIWSIIRDLSYVIYIFFG